MEAVDATNGGRQGGSSQGLGLTPERKLAAQDMSRVEQSHADSIQVGAAR